MPLTPGPGSEFATFGDRDLIMGLTSVEACLDLSADDLQVRIYIVFINACVCYYIK